MKIDCPVTTDLNGTLTLREDHVSCTVTVRNINVVITRADEGVVVDLFATDETLTAQSDDGLATTYAFFADATPEENEA